MAEFPLTFGETCALRLFRLIASPGNKFAATTLTYCRDADDVPYITHIKNLHMKGYIFYKDNGYAGAIEINGKKKPV